jgi:hypothetical protein
MKYIILLSPLLLASCSQSIPSIQPCDVLVKMTPAEASARYLVANDRSFAQSVAAHRGRYKQYKCGE